ncbi:MAG: hypothetical protein Q9167_003447 [Letrouitia subvulpina]
MNQLHPDSCNGLHMNNAIEMFQRPLESATAECPLCLNSGRGALTIGAFEEHVARHLESLALFALPHLEISETRSLGSVGTLDQSATGSYNSKNRDPLKIQSFKPSDNHGLILDIIGAMEPLQLSRYQTAASNRHPGSGLWFLEDPKYIRWKNNMDKVLLVQGSARCGKTILCSVVLEDLLFNSSSDDRGVGFCFFETSDDSQDLSEQTLRLIIIQLYAQLKGSTEDIRQLIDNGLWDMDLEKLMPILQRAINLHGSVYIILDALNAVDTTVTTLMSQLIQYFDKQGSRIQLIATSRINLNVEEALMNTNNSNVSSWRNCVAKYYLNISKVSLDIKKVALDRFASDPRYHIISSEDKEAFAEVLMQSSNGLDRGVNSCNSFEWAALAIQNIRFSTLQKTFHDLQRYSPLEIENVWSEILHRICSWGKYNTKSVARMFRLLSVAVAPVNLESLIYFSSGQCLTYLRCQRECPAVYEILWSFNQTLSLHPSLITFLRSEQIKQGSLRAFYINLEEAQQEIAEECVARVLQKEFGWADSRLSSRFTDYSMQNWHVHAASMPPYGSARPDQTFQQRCIQLLDPQHNSFKYWTDFMTRGIVTNRKSWGKVDLKDYPPPLYYATLLDLYECARMLLDDGADPAANHPAAEYHCPFIAAVENGKDKFVSLFVKSGIDINAIDDGCSPLFRAAKSGRSGIIEILLANYANLELKSEQCYTALHGACINHHYRVIKLLLDAGADIEARDYWGNTPLLRTVILGQAETVKLLLDTGADVEARNDGGNTPLLLAVINCQLEHAKLLLHARADVEARNDGGNTPLLLAILKGHLECAKLLIETGADVEARDDLGNTPLLLAIKKNQLECAKLVIMKGADFRAQDTWGRSGFHLCHPYPPMTELLLDAGANVDEEDGFGETALYCAARDSNDHKVEVLLDTGANPNLSQRDAVWSPLETAIMRYRKHEMEVDTAEHGPYVYRYGRVISLLLSRGANLEKEWITAEWSDNLREICGVSDKLTIANKD